MIFNWLSKYMYSIKEYAQILLKHKIDNFYIILVKQKSK